MKLPEIAWLEPLLVGDITPVTDDCCNNADRLTYIMPRAISNEQWSGRTEIEEPADDTCWNLLDVLLDEEVADISIERARDLRWRTPPP